MTWYSALNKKHRINKYLWKMIQARSIHRAFHPNGPQKILSLSPEVFAVMRTSPEGDRCVVTLTNVTKSKDKVQIPLKDVGGSGGLWCDLLSAKEFKTKQDLLSITLQPYDVLWLIPPT